MFITLELIKVDQENSKLLVNPKKNKTFHSP